MQSSKQKRKQMLKPGEIIPIIYDYVFTSIFNNPKNIDILEVFIADILNIPLEKIKGKVELQPRELEIQNKNNKRCEDKYRIAKTKIKRNRKEKFCIS